MTIWFRVVSTLFWAGSVNHMKSKLLNHAPDPWPMLRNTLGIASWRLKRILPERPVVMRWFFMVPKVPSGGSV